MIKLTEKLFFKDNIEYMIDGSILIAFSDPLTKDFDNIIDTYSKSKDSTCMFFILSVIRDIRSNPNNYNIKINTVKRYVGL